MQDRISNMDAHLLGNALARKIIERLKLQGIDCTKLSQVVEEEIMDFYRQRELDE